ncbi:hypothetical protein GCM10018954_082670 [Kutzneria kofuensis]
MSNNSPVTVEGGEIGRAQALQAAGLRAGAERPVQPGAAQARRDRSSQVVVLGKAVGEVSAMSYRDRKREALRDRPNGPCGAPIGIRHRHL